MLALTLALLLAQEAAIDAPLAEQAQPAVDAPAESLAARVARQPVKVRAFIDRRTGCNHWGGEEGYDAPRKRQIEHAWRDLRCNALERDEAKLRRLYHDDPELVALLDAVRNEPGL